MIPSIKLPRQQSQGITSSPASGEIKFLLVLFLFLLPWQTIWIYQEQFINGFKWEYGTLGFYGTEILLWSTVIFFLIWFWQKRKNQITNNKLKLSKDRIFALSCLVFIVYSSLSFFWAISPDLANQHSLRIMGAVILFFMLWLGPVPARLAGNSLIGGATLQSILGIYQFLTQSTLTYKWLGLVEHPAWQAGTSIVSSPSIGRWLRAYGAFPHPNIFAGYLVICIFTTIYLLQKRTAWGWIYYFILMLELMALFFTFSRSAWLALMIGSFLFTIFEFKKRKTAQKKKELLLPVVCAILFVAILTKIFWPIVNTRIFPTSPNEIRSTTERISTLNDTAELFKENKLLGVGAGNYTKALIKKDPTKPGYFYQPTHNVPALVLSELGLVGVALLTILIASFLFYFKIKNESLRPEILILFSVLIPLYLLDHYLYSTYIGLILAATFISISLKQN